MSRRNSRSSRAPWATLLVIVGLIGALVAYWRAPELFDQLLETSASEPTTVTLPPPPIPAAPTAVVDVPTQPPVLTPVTVPIASTGPSGTLRAYDGGWYQLYFTNPRAPNEPKEHVGGIDERLVAFLNTATKTIDMAIYDFDLERVAGALAAAAGRGVRVRMVTDSDTLANDDAAIRHAFAIVRRAGIPIVEDGGQGLMHNKFVIVDGAAVWTGSWNFTDGDTYRLNNNAIIIPSLELARNYTIEFEQLFIQQQFGAAKRIGLGDPVITVGGARIENYFAPQNQVSEQIIARLKLARTSIHFMAFSFTSDTIGKAVRTMEKAGVQVSGVFETTGSETLFSEYGKFRKLKLDVLQDGNPYVMHHKVFIIDSQTVIFGSFNFTNNADKDNDENLLIIDDPALALAFEAEFQRVYAQAQQKAK